MKLMVEIDRDNVKDLPKILENLSLRLTDIVYDVWCTSCRNANNFQQINAYCKECKVYHNAVQCTGCGKTFDATRRKDFNNLIEFNLKAHMR